MDGWMGGWIEDSIAIVDAYIASIAIRIMSDTRDEEKDRNSSFPNTTVYRLLCLVLFVPGLA